MDQVYVDFRHYDASHVENLPRKEVRFPRPEPQTGAGATVLRSAVSAGAAMSPAMGMADQVLNVAALPPRTSWIPSEAALAAAGSPSDLTFALGVVGSYAAVIGPMAGAGIYASTSGEIGGYGTWGTMLVNNVTMSVGGAFTCMKGPPSQYFAGNAFAVGIDVTVAPPMVGVEGVLYFDRTARRPFDQPVGFGVGITYGWGLLPMNITVQYSYTTLRPRMLIR